MCRDTITNITGLVLSYYNEGYRVSHMWECVITNIIGPFFSHYNL